VYSQTLHYKCRFDDLKGRAWQVPGSKCCSHVTGIPGHIHTWKVSWAWRDKINTNNSCALLDVGLGSQERDELCRQLLNDCC